MSFLQVIEILSVIFSLLYLFLLMKENIWCWLFGILSSALSIYLFIDAKLYAEAILYLYYVGIGFYGWYIWRSASTNGTALAISRYSAKTHLFLLSIGVALSLSLGYFFSTQTDAEHSYIDSHTTIFSFIASYLEAHKILGGWLYWIVINAVSVILYFERGLQIYAALMVVYFGLSVVAYFSWRKKHERGLMV